MSCPKKLSNLHLQDGSFGIPVIYPHCYCIGNKLLQGFPQKNEKASWYLAVWFQRGAQFVRGAQFERFTQFVRGAQFVARSLGGQGGMLPLQILIRKLLYMHFGCL